MNSERLYQFLDYMEQGGSGRTFGMGSWSTCALYEATTFAAFKEAGLRAVPLKLGNPLPSTVPYYAGHVVEHAGMAFFGLSLLEAATLFGVQTSTEEGKAFRRARTQQAYAALLRQWLTNRLPRELQPGQIALDTSGPVCDTMHTGTQSVPVSGGPDGSTVARDPRSDRQPRTVTILERIRALV